MKHLRLVSDNTASPTSIQVTKGWCVCTPGGSLLLWTADRSAELSKDRFTHRARTGRRDWAYWGPGGHDYEVVRIEAKRIPEPKRGKRR